MTPLVTFAERQIIKMRQKNSKRAFLASIMSLILCVTMLLGSTLAWFTDTVSNEGNRIKSGKLEIDLLMDKAKDGTYESIADGEGDIFSEAEGGNGTLWEPGKTEIVFLQVKNDGKLAVKYDMLLTVANDPDDTSKLTDVLDYVIIDGMTSSSYASLYQATGNASWDQIKGANGAQTGDVPEGTTTAAPNGQLLAGESDYVMLAVHMDEDAGNDYQDCGITIDVQIDATQLPYEEDSFGPDYDAAASEKEGTGESGTPEFFTIDLVKNGDFQTMPESGTTPLNWWSDASFVTEEDGNICAIFSKSASIRQNRMEASDTTKTYTLSVDVKKATTGQVEMMIEWWDTSSVPQGRLFTNIELAGEAAEDWTTVTHEFQFPENLGFFGIWIIGRDGTEAEPIYLDNVKLTYEGEVDKASLIAEEFRAMLAEEKANSQKVTVVEIDPYIEMETLEGQPETIIENGDFEDPISVELDASGAGWNPMNANSLKYVSYAEGEGVDGSNALKFERKSTDPITHPLYQQVVDIVGGAEYQVSFYYKITEGSQNHPCIKLEAWGDKVNELVTGYDQIEMGPKNAAYVRDGEWHRVVMRFRTPKLAKELHIYARMYTHGYEDQTAYLDNVTVTMTQAPLIMDLDTDSIFYYDDADTATFKTIANVNYFPELAEVKSDFQVYDGKTLVWEQKGVTASEGVATTTMSLAGLRKEVPYCVKATMYDGDGNVVDVQTHNIYIYSRPEYVTEDGIYMANGEEPFVPVIGYHVDIAQGHFDEVAEAGINMVQMTIFSSADQAVEYLDALQEAGLMGFIPLYANMKPAGDEVNIDRTIAILSDERVVNHPALFGYGVMDEVFLALEDPYEAMEASFRLIRMLDTKHPIMTVEALTNYYYEAGKLVDILVIDPYFTAASRSVSTSANIATEAVNYEKPVYCLCEAYRTGAGRFLTPEDARNNNWQALIGGADAVGYYSISDSERDENGNYTIPIWDANDGGALWEGIKTWGTLERDIAYAHFSLNESPVFNKDVDPEDPYWYYSWVVDGSVYMVVLGMEEEQELEVSIPLTSDEGNVSIGAYSAEVIAGDEEPVSGNGTLNLTVDGVEAILYKITPSTNVDFSSLN